VLTIDLPGSPLAPDRSPVRTEYRDTGNGPAIVFLHGGWGYEIYPFDRQIDALGSQYRIVIPNRSGYGRSASIRELPPDFHRRAMVETLAFLEALEIQRPILWGHSDGAIIALLAGLAAPDRIAGAIVEATHYYRFKPASRAFFEQITANPQALGGGVAAVMARDHGEGWPALLEMHSRTWLRISDDAASPVDDFYDGRLGELTVPVLAIHGARDPRTEPGELEALQAALQLGPRAAPSAPRTTFTVFVQGGHSPHSEAATADCVTMAAAGFLSFVSLPGHPARS